jgi:uncharacterized protein YidB (DUF937 family)
MGLLDVLNGMQQGPRGQSNPNANASATGGMSPITMALLGLLAYKAVKSVGGSQAEATASGSSRTVPLTPLPGGKTIGTTPTDSPGGGSGGLLKSALGGLLGGSAAGGALSGGLGDLMKQFEQSGLGDTAKSWVSTGPSKTVSPTDLSKALSPDQIATLMKHTGMSRDELMAALSQHLPDVVNYLTPEGRVPTAQELSRLV